MGLSRYTDDVDGESKPGEPHGAYEHQPERVVGVLELGVEVLLDHPLAVLGDVESGLGHVGDLVLGL